MRFTVYVRGFFVFWNRGKSTKNQRAVKMYAYTCDDPKWRDHSPKYDMLLLML